MGWTHTDRFRSPGEQKTVAHELQGSRFSDKLAKFISSNLQGASIDPLSQQIWEANPPNGVLCGLFDLQTLTIYLYPIADSVTAAAPLVLPGSTAVTPFVHTPGGTSTSHRQTFAFHFEGNDTAQRREDVIGFSVRRDPTAGGNNHLFHCQSVGFNREKFHQWDKTYQREPGYFSREWINMLQAMLSRYLP